MITSDQSFRLALEQLSQVYLAIASLRAEHPNAKPEWLAVMAEGFIDHARQLQREIDDYTGVAVLASDGNGKPAETREPEQPGERSHAERGN